MKTAAAIYLSLALPLCAATFNVRDLGATGDGKTFDTTAIQKALDACKDSGGTVTFPAGTYLSQPLKVGTKTTILLDAGATLLASTNQMDFMKVPGDWLAAKSGGDFIPFISGKDLTDVTFTGAGVIDGNGAVWWGEAEKARQIKSGYTLPRPNLIVIERTKNLRMENLTLQNSPKFHFVPTECEGVVISNVTVLAPERAPNTDAIDPSCCKNVLITKCLIDVGDDNIAIKSGHKVAGREAAVENVWVERCKFLKGHGMSIGSETLGGVRNLVVTNCTFDGTTSGIRIKSARGKGGLVEHLIYTDITMTNVDYPIYLTSYYPKVPSEDAAQPVAADSPVYRNIVIRNLTAHGTRAAGMIVGLPELPIENVTLENVRVTAPTGLTFRNAKAIKLQDTVITPTKGGKPVILETQAEVEGLPRQ